MSIFDAFHHARVAAVLRQSSQPPRAPARGLTRARRRAADGGRANDPGGRDGVDRLPRVDRP
jgi:hypothetical protein